MIYLDNTTEQQKVSIPKVTEGIAFLTTPAVKTVGFLGASTKVLVGSID